MVLRVKVPRKPLYSSLGLEPSYCGILAQDAPGSTDATKGLGNRGEVFWQGFLASQYYITYIVYIIYIVYFIFSILYLYI